MERHSHPNGPSRGDQIRELGFSPDHLTPIEQEDLLARHMISLPPDIGDPHLAIAGPSQTLPSIRDPGSIPD